MNPYRKNAYVEPPSHTTHGLSGSLHVGAPTELQFCNCGAILDGDGHEVHPRQMRVPVPKNAALTRIYTVGAIAILLTVVYVVSLFMGALQPGILPLVAVCLGWLLA